MRVDGGAASKLRADTARARAICRCGEGGAHSSEDEHAGCAEGERGTLVRASDLRRAHHHHISCS